MMKKFLTFMILSLIGQNSVFAEVVPLPDGFNDIKSQTELRLAQEPIANCYQNLAQSYDLELLEFLKFLETNFQNKSSTSSLLNIAISRYAQFKLQLRSLYLSLSPGIDPVSNRGLSVDELSAYQTCAIIRDSYADLAKEKLIEYVKNSQAQKKTIVMVDKYKAINSKLRDLNLDIARMYGYFMTFKEKLPWFTRECLRI